MIARLLNWLREPADPTTWGRLWCTLALCCLAYLVFALLWLAWR